MAAVLQPELVNQNPSSVDASASNLLFFYEYDERGRVVQKLVPGAGWTYLVYNRLDQAVLTQNERQRSDNKWTFSKYDAFGRVVLTGELTNTASQSTLQANFNSHSTPYEDRTGSQFGYTNGSFPFTTTDAEVCVVNYYDNYDWSPPANFNSSGALGTSGSVQYQMLLDTAEVGSPQSYNTVENNAPYLMMANASDFTVLYALNHGAFGFFYPDGNGGNVYDIGLRKGHYKLVINYQSAKGEGPFPAVREPRGTTLATKPY
ncbi:MAG: hypothetical protein U0X91_00440 [Spirosomataceae bacterium]